MRQEKVGGGRGEGEDGRGEGGRGKGEGGRGKGEGGRTPKTQNDNCYTTDTTKRPSQRTSDIIIPKQNSKNK